MNKPNKQTVLPIKNVSQLFSNLPIQKIKGLGGKFGEDVCEKLKIKLMSELSRFSQTDLQKHFDDKSGLWLYQIARGIDLEAVTPRFASKSIGCCKKFPGRNSIKGIATLNHWLKELSKEIVERLERDEIENSRIAKQIVVSFTQQFPDDEVASTRCISLNSIDVDVIAQDALDVIKKNTEVFFKNDQNTVISNPITLLGISAGKFEEFDRQKKITIKDMFSKAILNDATKKVANELKENSEDRKLANSKLSNSSNIRNFFSTVKNNVNGTEEENCAIDDDELIDESNSRSEEIVDSVPEPEEDATIPNSSSSIPSEQTLAPISSTTTAICTNSEQYVHDQPFPSNQSDVQPGPSNQSDFPPGPSNQPDVLPGPSNQPDYRETYVEFLCPTIPDDFYEICTQCNKKLLTIEMQSHLDMHLAFQLSQEQRIEFRSKLKTRSSDSPPVAKKPKLDRNFNIHSSSPHGSGNKVARNTNSTFNGKGALTKYFEQKKEDVDESASVKCEECGKSIRIEDVAEHSDYHAAKKLQIEINSLSTGAVVTSASSAKIKSSTNSTSKRRSIASFFKAKN